MNGLEELAARIRETVADLLVLAGRLRLELAEQRRQAAGEPVERMLDRSGPPRRVP